MAVLDLSTLQWSLSGYRPYEWRLAADLDALRPEVGPVKAVVPGSVQQALLDAGLIEDWNVGYNARACEWVEHRHWAFTATIPAGVLPAGETVVLNAQGLDHAGWVLVDGVEAGRFDGMLMPHRIPLSQSLGDGQAHRLTLVFDQTPPEQGQFGYTSRSRYFKSRYNYSWDWCPRIVPTGVWDALALETGVSAAVEVARVRTSLDAGLAVGDVEAVVVLDPAVGSETRLELRVMLRDGDTPVGNGAMALELGENVLSLTHLPVTAWCPNGAGDPKTYRLELFVANDAGAILWVETRQVGFRRIAWQACDGAPVDAEPWICVVNGRPIFLQGANWVPARAVYQDVTEADYRSLIGLYREMGANVLRVWGGGILETERFYDLCDEAGLLVWQEFPLSSSGVENCPPDAPEALDMLETIARSYIRRRAHHASLLLWCGGNELIASDQRPVDYEHPCIARMKGVVEADDPERRFLPTSPSGPRFCASADDYGKGVHHDIHGPWGFGGLADLDAWRGYFEEDDSLFRSETGMPGACSVAFLERYAAGHALWPPTAPYWHYIISWWVQWDRFEKDLGSLPAAEGLAEYVKRSQALQAEAYAIAARACKRRFPRCGGFIIWMGHDCYPCPANNAVIDFDRQCKPAYYALQQVFREPAGA